MPSVHGKFFSPGILLALLAWPLPSRRRGWAPSPPVCVVAKRQWRVNSHGVEPSLLSFQRIREARFDHGDGICFASGFFDAGHLLQQLEQKTTMTTMSTTTMPMTTMLIMMMMTMMMMVLMMIIVMTMITMMVICIYVIRVTTFHVI